VSRTDPTPTPTPQSNNFLLASIAVVLSIVVAGLVHEAIWRPAAAVSSVVATQAQQLQEGERDLGNGDNRDAYNAFDRLAARDDVDAEYWLAHMTELGLGVEKNVPKAIALYEKAAAKGSTPAETRLGEIYLQGDATLPDYPKAFALLGKAARQGDSRAAMVLGKIYRLGLGAPADTVESYAWSEVAVLEGFGFAKGERDAVFAAMTPADRNKAAARAAAILDEIRKIPEPPKAS
jgi:hypothetical protein